MAVVTETSLSVVKQSGKIQSFSGLWGEMLLSLSSVHGPHENRSLIFPKSMRTKTLLALALLGVLGSVSALAQLNAVGFINVTVGHGYGMISCPLFVFPDNTIGTLLNNANGEYNGDAVYFYNPGTGGFDMDKALPVGDGGTTNANGWLFGGTNVLAPGLACWFQNNQSNAVTMTFVGNIPDGYLTNTLVPGYNLVSNILPTDGDLCTNPLLALTNYNEGDAVYTYSGGSFTIFQSGTGRGRGGSGCSKTPGGKGDWSSTGDPVISFVGQGFWYYNSGPAIEWVEYYTLTE